MSELGERTYDNLIAGTNQLEVSDGETLLADEVAVRGQVMAKITASGKWVTYKSGGAGGEEIPRGIAAEDVDASDPSADAPITIYKTGEFNENALVFDGVDTLTEAVKNQLQDVNIHTKGSIDTAGVHT
ncbi:MAG: head decoration protein [Salinimicrobium sediminis]|nr:head decoration protein [Salinimicrobium sediminis]